MPHICISDDDEKRSLNGRYVSKQDKILLWDNKHLGYRGDYNGVLLLDTILQKPITCPDHMIRLELLVSEAVIFLQSMKSVQEVGLETCPEVVAMLTAKIQEAQANAKKGIKAQKVRIIIITNEIGYGRGVQAVILII